MPLSDREQRILQEIEKSLYQEDPSFAREVKRNAPRMADRRRVLLGAAAVVAGFLVLIGFFVTGLVVIGVLAFASMVAGIVTIAGSFKGFMAPRRPPGPRLGDRISSSAKSWEEKMRDRYKRRE
ncbi:MAG: DUF3040 domain-containing protein [Actinomycetota bacterium]